MKRFMLILGTVVALVCFMTSGYASATAVMDFGTGGSGVNGTVKLLAGGNMLGFDIPIDVLTVVGAPTGNGVYDLSGNGVSAAEPPNGAAVLAFNTSLNVVTITGGIPALHIPNGTVLLSGTFSSWRADADGLHDARGRDIKYRGLLIDLGLDPATPFTYFGFSIDTNGLADQVDGDSVISCDLRNTAVPEPATLLLLGLGLVGLAIIRKEYK